MVGSTPTADADSDPPLPAPSSAIPPESALAAENQRQSTRSAGRSLRDNSLSPASSSSSSSPIPIPSTSATAPEEPVNQTLDNEDSNSSGSLSSTAEPYTYELTFVLPSHQAQATAGMLADPLIIRIRRFSDSEVFPAENTSPQSSTSATQSSPSEDSINDGPLLVQLSLFPEFDPSASERRPLALCPSSMQGALVRSPEVYTDIGLASSPHPALHPSRLFAIFSDVRVLTPGHYTLAAILLRGVMPLPQATSGSIATASAPPVVAQPGREIASVYIPLSIEGDEVNNHDAAAPERENESRLSQVEMSVLMHFRNQGADV
ncbi:uncharacterized protein V2V93DRAFT_196805 [Kockiozyma suomiensis]|uniref:uncharacterized protein n=1 Tax=Kockiozyma suomiensis TaxID=1337062 RepID=UPI003343FD77